MIAGAMEQAGQGETPKKQLNNPFNHQAQWM
jgi:hypothetical protein